MFCTKALYTALLCLLSLAAITSCSNKPVVVATWWFVNATEAAWHILKSEGTAVNAVEAGGTRCEEEQCDTTVGYGGSPDEHGETALDAMIMDGSTFEVGAVANLRNIKNAISVAHAVMKYTKHTLLVGSLATEFAEMMGFPRTNLSTPQSVAQWLHWKKNSCQPNFRKNVVPDPHKSCGPYSPVDQNCLQPLAAKEDEEMSMMRSASKEDEEMRMMTHASATDSDHDTMGIVTLDVNGNVAGGTTTNGATFKIPGRVGDSPIVGSGAYADNEAGAAAATGDGDFLMRFLPSFVAVELMRSGVEPTAAAAAAVRRISHVYPSISAGVVALNMTGDYGAACHGFSKFSFTVMTPQFTHVQLVHVPCTHT